MREKVNLREWGLLNQALVFCIVIFLILIFLRAIWIILITLSIGQMLKIGVYVFLWIMVLNLILWRIRK